jgi:hypothetical protein
MIPPATTSDAPRLVPDVPFPPYAFVPGLFPHPTSDPAGHSYGVVRQPPEPPRTEHWHACHTYLRGLDLFNHGYYWEAHEAWEALWHACGRRGVTASFLKGLIALAAAGVKVREGRREGVRSHARRAAERFQQVAASLDPPTASYMGLSVPELRAYAEGLADRPEVRPAMPEVPVEIVFSFKLRPEGRT